MSDKLIPCPFCGHTEYRTYKNMAWLWVRECKECVAKGPPCKTKEEAIAAGNRRFVCYDENGKKVYAGDEVKAYIRPTERNSGDPEYDTGTLWWDKKDLLWRLAISGDDVTKKRICMFYDQIELIAERKEG